MTAVRPLTLSPRLALLAAVLVTSAASASEPISVKDLEVFQADGVTEIYVETSGPPVFESTSSKDPPVIIVDLVGARGAPEKVNQPGGPVTALSFKDVQGKSGRPVARLTLKFDREVTYDVTAERNIVRLRVFHDGKSVRKGQKVAMGSSPRRDGFATDATPVRLAQEDSAGASTGDGSGGGAKMTYIGFKNTSDSSRVFVRMNVSNAKYKVKKEGENLIVLEITNASIPLDNNKNYLDTTFFESPVKMITPSEVEDDPPTIRVTIEMKENVPYEDKREGKDIALYYKM